MLKRIHKAMDEREDGFTLIELLVVIIIIGILAAIAIPVFLNQRKKGYDASVKADLRNLANAEESYKTDDPSVAYIAATGTAALVAALPEFVPTRGNLFGVSANVNGYCAQGKNPNSDKFWTYDSSAGGLQTSSSTTASTAACSVPGTTAGTTLSYVAPAA